MHDYSNYKFALYDLMQALLERARESQGAASGTPSDQFEAGRNMAYIEVISVGRRVALQFQIDPDELLLPKDPENELLATAESSGER
jgi:hypothetical protein